MDMSAHEARLRARRAELVGDLGRIEAALDQPADPDWDDRASERQGDEVLEALGGAEQAELRRIDTALARIAEGSYGTCAECDTPISPARLEAVPDALLCRQCAGAGPA